MNKLNSISESEQTAENTTRNTASFVNNLRSVMANEAKLSFTLPRFGYGMAKDVAIKAFGFGSFGLWTKVAAHQPSNELLDSGKEVALTTSFASGMALAGLATVVWANRIREKSDEVYDELHSDTSQPV